MSRRTAIVFNCSYNGLSIVQELGREGIPCVAMDSGISIGAFSRYARFRLAPDPERLEEAFIEYLVRFCGTCGEKPVLFPTNDTWAMALSRHRARVSEVAIPCVCPFEVIELLIDKQRFSQVGVERGYTTPRVWTREEAERLPGDAFPIIAKPRSRKVAADVRDVTSRELLRLRMVLLESPAMLTRFLERERDAVPHLVFQEYVPGLSDSMYTVGVYADASSRILGMFTGHKVRGYPADSGDNVVGEAFDLPAEVTGLVERIVFELGYTGIAEFEFKRDARTGEYRLIEINPRAWSWIGITAACGVNLPVLAYRDLCGEPVEYTRSTVPTGSVRYAKVMQDAANCLFRYRRDHPAWAMSLSEWRHDLQRAERLVVAEASARDWGVAVASVPYFLLRLAAGR